MSAADAATATPITVQVTIFGLSLMVSKILDSVSVNDPSSFLSPHFVVVFSFLASVLPANASKPAIGLLQPALYSSSS